jgi:hypothetical protein
VNWKSSLSGAVLVAIAGLVVGVAVGGKTTTHTATATVTVDRTTTVVAESNGTTSTTSSTSTDSAGTAGGTTTTSISTTSGSKQYYADYLANQGTQQLDNNATSASLDSNPSSLQLKGQTYQNAVAIDLSPDGSNPITESYQLPVPGLKHFSSPIAGLNTNASAKTSFKLTIYKNNDNPGATVLYTATFAGPSDTHPISFDTQGATDLVLDWTEPPHGEPSGSYQFIIADPIVTS